MNATKDLLLKLRESPEFKDELKLLQQKYSKDQTLDKEINEEILNLANKYGVNMLHQDLQENIKRHIRLDELSDEGLEAVNGGAAYKFIASLLLGSSIFMGSQNMSASASDFAGKLNRDKVPYFISV